MEIFWLFRRNLNLPGRHPGAGKESKMCQWARREPGAPRGVPPQMHPNRPSEWFSSQKMPQLTEKLREKAAQGEGDICTVGKWTLDEYFTRNLTIFLLDECSDQLYGKCCKMRQPPTLNYFYIKIPGNAGNTTKPLSEPSPGQKFSSHGRARSRSSWRTRPKAVSS